MHFCKVPPFLQQRRIQPRDFPREAPSIIGSPTNSTSTAVAFVRTTALILLVLTARFWLASVRPWPVFRAVHWLPPLLLFAALKKIDNTNNPASLVIATTALLLIELGEKARNVPSPLLKGNQHLGVRPAQSPHGGREVFVKLWEVDAVGDEHQVERDVAALFVMGMGAAALFQLPDRRKAFLTPREGAHGHVTPAALGGRSPKHSTLRQGQGSVCVALQQGQGLGQLRENDLLSS
mmetsp:Transcript_71616/g.144170  ORF Transcript_71616/g.144170 Transcript_71616/m.144170 type:complete len:236 (+) Transcript_71616:41-748(+)